MISLNKAEIKKEYLVVKVTTDFKQTQRLGHLGLYGGIKVKVIQEINDMRRVIVGLMTYVFSEYVCKNIIVVPV